MEKRYPTIFPHEITSFLALLFASAYACWAWDVFDAGGTSRVLIFVDTSYFLALYNPRDQYHQQAIRIKEKITAKQKLWITEAVLTEIGNAWSKSVIRDKACILIESCYSLSSVMVVPCSDILFQKAFSLYRVRKDKDWSLTDCMSFVVMKENNLTDVLTTDEHFRQAGFNSLLL